MSSIEVLGWMIVYFFGFVMALSIILAVGIFVTAIFETTKERKKSKK